MNDLLKTIRIAGMGWLDGQSSGCIRMRERVGHGELPPWKRPDLFGGPVKNLGRFDAVSRSTFCACALAIRDAGLTVDECRSRDTGIIGSGGGGSLDANRAYFSDYVQAGRKLGRGNFFIYTLPTSPLAEATIHFGFRACMLYMSGPDVSLRELVETAALAMADGQAAGMLTVRASGQEAIAFLLEPCRKTEAEDSAGVEDICSAVSRPGTLAEQVLEIERATGRSRG